MNNENIAITDKQKEATKPNYQITYHKDGTMSYWSVFHQMWLYVLLVGIPSDVVKGANKRCDKE